MYYDASAALLPNPGDPEIDDTLFVVSDPLADAGDPVAICSGDSVVIGGTPTASDGVGPYTYSWAPTTGLDDASAANPTSTPGATITYTVTITDSGGCTDQDSVTVTVNPACINLLRNADVTQLSPQTPPNEDIFTGADPALDPANDLEKSNYSSGGSFTCGVARSPRQSERHIVLVWRQMRVKSDWVLAPDSRV